MNNSQVICLQFKFEDFDGIHRSVSYLQKINKSQKDLLYLIFIEFWDLKSENYTQFSVKNIIFTYKLSENKNSDLIKINRKEKCIKLDKENPDKFDKLYGIKLPLTMDIFKWGDVHLFDNNKQAIVYKKKSPAIYRVKIFSNYLYVEYVIENRVLFTFRDFLTHKYDLDSFKRKVKNTSYYIIDSEIKLTKNLRKTKFIKPVKPSIYLSDKFLTMDLECRKINNKLEPYCLCIYDGKTTYKFFLSDYTDSDHMLKEAILSLMTRKYHRYRIYLHNLSKFDGIFLLRILTLLSDNVQPIIKDGQIIEIKFYFSKYFLYFRDSLLLLPSPLANLAQMFNVEEKGTYPIFCLDNYSLPLNYRGAVPAIDKFKDISISDYKIYCKEFEEKLWDLKFESLKYCEQDCKTLFFIIYKFGYFIFNEVRLDIGNYPTLPSLALASFRCKFLNKSKLPIISGQMFSDIHKAYTGGNVDVYKPSGNNLYYYDVNSLYPYVMKSKHVPVGSPTFFIGNILAFDKRPFGIFKVEVTAPLDMNIPFLQHKVKTEYGLRTTTPIGSWVGTYTSDEIYKAMELGYKIKVLNGYLFKKKVVFRDYVDFFYKIKNKSPKNTSEYTISKLMLNSLYGRLGMKPNQDKHLIIEKDQFDDFFENNVITNIIYISDSKVLITIKDPNIKEDDILENINISIPIAAFITARARMHIFDFKNIENNTCYYTDTDSVVLERELNNSLVGREIGKMKLEHFINKGVFLAPKVYSLLTEEGEITKIKGFSIKEDKNKILKYDNLKNLLNRNEFVVLNHEKWQRNIEKGMIYINKENYTLNITNGKRILIFDENNVFKSTKPINIQELEEYKKETPRLNI